MSAALECPELAEALAAEPCERFAVDGEVVAFDGAQTSFAKLAQRGQSHVRVFLYAFDLVWLEGYDMRALPLRSRKRVLRSTLRFEDGLRFTPHTWCARDDRAHAGRPPGGEGHPPRQGALPAREAHQARPGPPLRARR
ncbi:MAG: hypothetical protein ACR2IN_07935, partial [Thermoleophilaceae bacterium]